MAISVFINGYHFTNKCLLSLSLPSQCMFYCLYF